ncbi:unnamed protein product [Leptosia nina]|uniref:DDE-1 domain-containing protein n=1 Tax=Leptosia nina TaxID=320188 RepID=A0AAV1IZG9_9NEOP
MSSNNTVHSCQQDNEQGIPIIDRHPPKRLRRVVFELAPYKQANFEEDGHKSHLSYQCSQFYHEKGIVLIPLFPNATHLLQLLDVAVFKPLKVAWRKRVHMWRIEKIQSEEGHALKKKDFAILLKEVMEESLTLLYQ